MRARTLLILGATGLVGQQLLAQALVHPDVARVVAPTRRPLPPHPRLFNPQPDFTALPTDAPWWQADAVLCALGTTLKLAGSKAAFRAVDHDLVLLSAQCARRAGTPAFVLNSSLGASARSGSFYLQVKGQAEEALSAVGFVSLTFVRPSLLAGGPRPDARPGEALGLWFARWLRPIIPPRYRAVPVAAVARAMLAQGLQAVPGTWTIESDMLHESPRAEA